MAGLPGTGKTTLARELAERTGGRVIGKDELRGAIFSLDEIEYSSRQDDFCLELLLQLAGYLLQRSPRRLIFIDGRPFSRRYQIENVLNAAHAMHQSWRILECVCPQEIAQLRLQQECGQHSAGNRNYKLHLDIKAHFETITFVKTMIDTTRPLDACIKQALVALQ